MSCPLPRMGVHNNSIRYCQWHRQGSHRLTAGVTGGAFSIIKYDASHLFNQRDKLNDIFFSLSCTVYTHERPPAIQNSSSTSNSSSKHISTIRRCGTHSRVSTADIYQIAFRVNAVRWHFVSCRVEWRNINLWRPLCRSLCSALDRPSNQFFFACLCVCEQIGCWTITSTVLYRFSRNFACGSEMRQLTSPIVCETNRK